MTLENDIMTGGRKPSGRKPIEQQIIDGVAGSDTSGGVVVSVTGSLQALLDLQEEVINKFAHDNPFLDANILNYDKFLKADIFNYRDVLGFVREKIRDGRIIYSSCDLENLVIEDL